ncbi:hypothetical protein AURDEDRAFT_180745 [Auricularia subglabra TFB-10046 SS5]|nr:hypothetical protein AURDEDRAFT_180745 [Auricularia subglabra TFB-10046 SS5]
MSSSYRTLRLLQDIFLPGRVQPWEQKKKLAQAVWEALQSENAVTVGMAIDFNGERSLVLSEDEAERVKRSINLTIRPRQPPSFKSVSPISFAKAQHLEKCMDTRKSKASDEECTLLCYLSYYPDDKKHFSVKNPSNPVRVVALSIRHWDMDSKTRLGFQICDGLMGRKETETCNFQSRDHAALDRNCSKECRLSSASRDVQTGLQVLKDKLCSGSPTVLLVLEADEAVTTLLQEAGVTVTSSLSGICQPQDLPSRSSSSTSRDYRGSSYRPPHDGYGDRYRPQRDRGWDRGPSRGVKREYDDDSYQRDERRRSRSPRRMSPRGSRARSRSPPRAFSSVKVEEDDTKPPPAHSPSTPILLPLRWLYRTARNDLTNSFGVKTLSLLAPIKCERHCSDVIYNAFMTLVKGPSVIQVVTDTAPPTQNAVPPSAEPAPASAPVFDEDDTEPQAPILPTTGTTTAREAVDAFSDYDEDDEHAETLYHAPSQSTAFSANRYENEHY